jgi:small subunit ribosomal protein S1
MISDAEYEKVCEETLKKYIPDTIVKAKIVGEFEDKVVVDVGLKSEGYIPKEEFAEATIEPGQEVEVYIEGYENEGGVVSLSKKKADRIRLWEKVLSTLKEGDEVEGKIVRKVKGGAILDIGVPVFIPTSQLDTKRVEEVMDYVGMWTKAIVLKIDHERMNIIVSRKKYILTEKELKKKKLLETLKVGDIVEATVKNIADFGVIVEIDDALPGLVRASDLSWNVRIKPQEVVKLNENIKAQVLHIDYEKERLFLGIKQLTKDPWEDVEGKFSIGQIVKADVRSVVPYGAYCVVESVYNAFIPVAEFSSERKTINPHEFLKVGDNVQACIIRISKEKRELVLSLKQVATDPWREIEKKYPIGTVLKAPVKKITTFGAFLAIEPGLDALLHISDISWKKIKHPQEVLKENEIVEVVVLSLDITNKRISVGMKQLKPNPWESLAKKYKEGDSVTAKVVRFFKGNPIVELEEVESSLTGVKVKGKESANLGIGDMVEGILEKIDPVNKEISIKFVKKL